MLEYMLALRKLFTLRQDKKKNNPEILQVINRFQKEVIIESVQDLNSINVETNL